MDDKALDNELDWIDSVVDSVAEKMSSLGAEYPDWLPERDLKEFERAEQRLIVQYGVEQVEEWLRAYQYNVSQIGEYARQIPIPPKVRMDVHTIHRVLAAIESGQYEGLPTLVGENGAKSLDIAQRVSSGNTKRESHTHKIEFQELVRQHKCSFSTLADLKRIKEFDFYINNYGNGHTLRDWINEVMPGHLKRGAPKKNK